MVAEIPKGTRLEKLNKMQLSHMENVKQFWLDYIFSCKNQINKDAACIGIEWMYKTAGLDRPIIIFVDSPMACQYALLYLKAMTKMEILPSGVKNLDQVGDQVRDQVRAQVWDQVGDQVGQVGQVWAQVWDQVGDQVGDQVAQVWAQVWEFETFCSYGSITDYGWLSFFDFFTQIGIINHKGFNQFKNLLQSGIYDMIQLNGFCIVSGLPTELYRDNQNRLHNVNGASIKFRDEYAQFFIHGVYITPAMHVKLLNKEYTFADWVKEENEEIKSAILSFIEEKWGSEYLFRFISDNLKEVCTYTDQKQIKYLSGTTGGMNIGVYTLFNGQVNNISIAFVRCYCPSTDRMFFLSVDPSNKNAKDAIASLYRVPSKLKDEIKYIQRQGERFSSVFTEKGNVILASMSKDDLENLIGISGDEYFNKMRYEY